MLQGMAGYPVLCEFFLGSPARFAVVQPVDPGCAGPTNATNRACPDGSRYQAGGAVWMGARARFCYVHFMLAALSAILSSIRLA